MKIYAGIGSRKTPKFFCDLMTELAVELDSAGWILSSGGARGADQAFMRGSKNCHLWLPHQGSNGFQTDLQILPEAYEMAERFYHLDWDDLGDFGQAAMARNCHIVLGADLDTPVKFIICWTPEGKIRGGTGQALRIAKAYRIPVLNLGLAEMSNDVINAFLEPFVGK